MSPECLNASVASGAGCVLRVQGSHTSGMCSAGVNSAEAEEDRFNFNSNWLFCIYLLSLI